MFRALGSITAIVVLSASAVGDDVRFDRDIRPILSDACFHCHGPDAEGRPTDLRLDTSDGLRADLGDGLRAVVPGDLSKSELWHRVASRDADVQMPPPDSGRKLTSKQIDTLKCWIEQGAEWEPHWSFARPKRPTPPPVANDWARNPIDPFVQRKLATAELSPSPEASKETLVRRLTLDLTGLPPTLDEIDAFLADESPDAYERLVDRLLASPRYGEWMALPWLDAARYADTNGFQQDRTRTMWPWRDWVVRQLNENVPYDRFTVEQLAGDLLPNATTEQFLASGFHRNHMLNGEGGRIAEESRVEYVVDRVETTSTVWMGLTLGCARCHDHKYDPFTQREFYELYAYFNNVDESGRVDAGGNAKPVMPYPLPDQQYRIESLETRIAGLERELKQRPPVDEATFAAWERKLRAEVEASDASGWRVVVPHEFSSENGQTMTLLDDRSIFVTGENPAKDVYYVRTKLAPGTITGLRLEALPHESFTNGGLARSNSGNFVLTELEVEMDVKLTETSGSAESVKIGSAFASHEQGSLKITNAFDGNPNSGWAVLDGTAISKPRTGVFVFAHPLEVPANATLLLRLKQESVHASHNIGRFRLSVTSVEKPSLDGGNGLPDGVLAALAVRAADRTDHQKTALLDHFHATSARSRKLRAEAATARKSLADVRKATPQVMVMRERSTPRKTNVLIRGAYDKYGDEVTAALPSTLESPDLPAEADSRLDLANWLVDPDHPLTARVTVNRHWQHFFGNGLVRTPEDFGSQGQRPTHPELLDWLATEFVRSGWDVKHLHRLIVTSAAYRQSSNVTPERLAADPDNALLARGARHRLSAFGLRDQALALAGLLVERRGGPPVKPYQPARIWADFSFDKIKYVQDHGDALYRRTLYTFWRRSVGPTTLFDTSARQVCTVDVRRTNTPLHALTTLNDVTFAEAARKFAERIVREGGDTDDARVTWAFRSATARRPTAAELAVLRRAIERSRDHYRENAAEVDAVLSVGESPVDGSLDRTEIAAWSAVASLIINLDEVLVRE